MISLLSPQRLTILFLLLWGTWSVAVTAFAKDTTGQDFFRQAELYAEPNTDAPEAKVSAAAFNGYLWGTADILAKQGTVCLPQDVALNTMWLPVYQALKENPEQRQRTRSSLVAELLPALYPCTDAEIS